MPFSVASNMPRQWVGVFLRGVHNSAHPVICSGSQTRAREGSNGRSCHSSSMGRAAEAGAGGWHRELGVHPLNLPGDLGCCNLLQPEKSSKPQFLCSVGKAQREQSLWGDMLHCSAFRAAVAFAVCAPACVAPGLAGGCNLVLHSISTVIFIWSACWFLS